MGGKLLSILVVELVSMAVSLADFHITIATKRMALLVEHGGLSPQPHRTAHIRHILLLVQKTNHMVLAVAIEFR